MTQPINRTCGLPSVPRDSMPNMFEILGWSSLQQKKQQDPCNDHADEAPLPNDDNPAEIQTKQQGTMENASLVRSQYVKQSPKKRQAKSMTKSGIYEYREVHLKRSESMKKSETIGSKMVRTKIVEPVKKLDPQNEEDCRQIEERKRRIKKFEYVTRDLSNSAFTTYFGKPAWQAYGRSNSNPRLLSHNVMPHKGGNRPDKTQSYYSALLKGRNQSLSSHIPRKAIEEIVPQQEEEKRESSINLPIQDPDLINHVRFTAEPARKVKDYTIPSNVVAPSKTKPKKAQKKQKKKVSKLQKLDGLKYMNIRQDLLTLLEKKKTAGTKLAWKVTECYPFDLNNEQKMKQSTQAWQKVQAAGVESKTCDKLSQLLTFSAKEDSAI